MVNDESAVVVIVRSFVTGDCWVDVTVVLWVVVETDVCTVVVGTELTITVGTGWTDVTV